MPDLFPIAAIADEFSPDLPAAVRAMADIGTAAAELAWTIEPCRLPEKYRANFGL